jgi:hypothetical protein
MAELKKIPMSTVHEDIISMEFNTNPNIPTANYSEETAQRVQQAIAKKMKVDRLKRLIETELRQEPVKNSSESFGFEFSFKGM